MAVDRSWAVGAGRPSSWRGLLWTTAGVGIGVGTILCLGLDCSLLSSSLLVGAGLAGFLVGTVRRR